MAAVVVLALLFLLEWETTRMLGQRLIGIFESLIGRIPLVDSIYRSSKQFLTVATITPESERRIVLLNFPSPDMKALGLITRTIVDSVSGEELAVVYVPTSPNPTSAYIEIVPLRNVTFRDWTFDEAMSFIVTGGSSSPSRIGYSAAPSSTR